MTDRKIGRPIMIGGVVAGAGLAATAATDDRIVGAASAQTTPKTFVLIHGAWVGGWYWRRVSASPTLGDPANSSKLLKAFQLREIL
jgi:hypothetical protein